MPPHQLLDIFIGGIVVFLDVWRVDFLYGSLPAQFERTLQIIVTVPVFLDLLVCHSRAWLPREESRFFPTSSSGIRDSSRAPDTRAGMTEKFDRADVRVTIWCRTQIDGWYLIATRGSHRQFKHPTKPVRVTVVRQAVGRPCSGYAKQYFQAGSDKARTMICAMRS